MRASAAWISAHRGSVIGPASRVDALPRFIRLWLITNDSNRRQYWCCRHRGIDGRNRGPWRVTGCGTRVQATKARGPINSVPRAAARVGAEKGSVDQRRETGVKRIPAVIFTWNRPEATGQVVTLPGFLASRVENPSKIVDVIGRVVIRRRAESAASGKQGATGRQQTPQARLAPCDRPGFSGSCHRPSITRHIFGAEGPRACSAVHAYVKKRGLRRGASERAYRCGRAAKAWPVRACPAGRENHDSSEQGIVTRSTSGPADFP